jgi:hypothetical protein
MTQRLFLALGLLVAGTLAIASALYVIAGDELAMAVITFAAAAMVASTGVYLIACGVLILVHETKFEEWIKRWAQ